jgi:ankyrin repeat protein
MQKYILVLVLMFVAMSSAVWAECGRLCDYKWWETATASDVQALLDAGADVNTRDEDRNTPLHPAAISGTAEGVQLLITAGVDVNARNKSGYTPLHWAAALGTAETVQLLITAGADVSARSENGRTPLQQAAALGTAETIEALITAGADITAKDELGRSVWDLAQTNEKLAGTEALWALAEALGKCARLCDYKWWETATASDVQAELDAGANVNARDENGFTPIMISSAIGSAATVRALLDAGADVNLHAEMGTTVLMMAMLSNKQETFEVLVQAGATVDVNFHYLGEPLLHLIGRAQHGVDGGDNALWAVRWFIDAGADVNERGAHGYTLLHIACGDIANAEYCRMIINADNVNVDARNDRGETPLIAAITTEQSESVQLLLDAGADVKIKDNEGLDAWDLVKIYPDFKGTDIYWTIAKASGHCGRMCDADWWSKVKTSDLQKMLDTDAFTKLTDEDQKTAWNLAKSSPLKGSEVYWALNEARFK